MDVFWAHSPLLGLLNIVPQFVLILATIVRSRPLGGFVPAAAGSMGRIRRRAKCRDMAAEQLALCTADLRFFGQYCSALFRYVAAGFNFSSGKLSG